MTHLMTTAILALEINCASPRVKQLGMHLQLCRVNSDVNTESGMDIVANQVKVC